MEETVTYDTEAYDVIVGRMAAKCALFDQEELMEALTGADLPYSDDLGNRMRSFLWLSGIVLTLMAIAGFIANPVAGFAFAGCYLVLWCWMVNAGKEISASADGAGNMYRNQRVGRSPEWSKQAEERRQIRQAIIEHENPYDLLENLDDPEYVRTLQEALHRDEHGWTMSD